MQRITVALMALLFVGSSAVLSAEKYEIKLDRPVKVGQRFDFEATGTEQLQQRVVSAGRVIKQENSKLEGSLRARVTILAVKDGAPVKVKIEVRSMTMKKNGEAIEAPKRGTVITGSNNDAGSEIFEVADGVLSDEAHRLLKSMIMLSDGDEISEGAFMNAKGPKAVGEQWPVDSAVLAKQMSKRGQLPMKAENVKGKTTLVSAESNKALGLKCLRLKMVVEIKLDAANVPNGLTLRSGRVDAEGTMDVPVDTSHLGSRADMSMTFTMDGFIQPPGQPQVDVTATARHSVRRLTIPVD